MSPDGELAALIPLALSALDKALSEIPARHVALGVALAAQPALAANAFVAPPRPP
jgi:hypothetical protein